MTSGMLAAVLWLSVGARLPAEEARELVPVDGPRSAAQIKGIGPDWACTFQGTDREIELAIRDLVFWGAIHDTTSGSLALLADGGQLACQLRKGDRERVQLDSDLLGDVDLPLSQLTGLLLKTPSVPSQRDRLLARLREISGEKDWLLLENGDELSGTIASINHESLVLASDVGESRIELPKVVAIVFNPALATRSQIAADRVIVGFADGSRIVAAGVTSPTIDRCRFTTEGKWSFEVPLSDLVFLQPLSGRSRYLSDIEPQSYRHIPYLSLSWPVMQDQSVIGGALRFRDCVFPKGIGMHSASRVTYPIEADDNRFEADLAIDASSRNRGSVAFRVFVDNEQRFASEVIRGGDAPVPISVDVTGGKRLSLIVDFAERGDELDHANWLNARLVH